MERFLNKSFVFKANRYEEWQAGQCISQGSINTVITATTRTTLFMRCKLICFKLNNIQGLNIIDKFQFEQNNSIILENRIQYSTSSDFTPNVPIVCHLFCSNNGTIECVRFAMTNPDRIIEFYGELVSLSENSVASDKREIVSFTQAELTAIIKIAQEMITADGEILESEYAVLCSFLIKYGVIPTDLVEMLSDSKRMSVADAFGCIANLSYDKARLVAALLGVIMVADGDIDDREMLLCKFVTSMCSLPVISLKEAIDIMGNNSSSK